MNTQSVTKPVEKKKEEAKKPASNSMKEMEKISTYNGDSTEKYNWELFEYTCKSQESIL